MDYFFRFSNQNIWCIVLLSVLDFPRIWYFSFSTLIISQKHKLWNPYSWFFCLPFCISFNNIIKNAVPVAVANSPVRLPSFCRIWYFLPWIYVTLLIFSQDPSFLLQHHISNFQVILICSPKCPCSSTTKICAPNVILY